MAAFSNHHDLSNFIWQISHLKKAEEEVLRLLPEVMDEAMDKGEDRGDNGIFNSSIIPGSDWTDTVYQPIYDEACGYNEEQAKLFYGLLVWEAVMSHDEDWIFIRQEDESRDRPWGLTYFRRS